MKVYALVAENWKMDGGVAFGVVPQSIWKKQVAVDENNRINITTRCLLVDDGNRRILFDTGMGRKQNDKYYGFRFLFGDESLVSSLKAVGYKKEDITDVVFTHLHDDHCGAALYTDESGNPQPLFKNAMHHCSRAQWEWANNPNKREVGSFFKMNFSPLMDMGKMTLIEDEGPFTSNIEFRIMNGHTVGLIIPIIQAGDKRIVFAGDFIPLAANIPLPFIASVDIQPLEALKEKEQFLQEAIEKDYSLVFQHDYYIEACSLTDTLKGIRMDRKFRLNEILM